ncbi:MAG TPA: chromate transporter [Candidatus Limnocylindria bacterium]|nr:chromate transporter [Candidatus Limnocylindria bacterium]
MPLARLVRVFAWTGLTSIGGGRSAFFYDAVVLRRRWVTDAEFLQDVTISQILPGPNFSNLAIALGYRLAGAAGAAWALLAVAGPGALILLAVAMWYFARGFSPAVSAVMHGMGGAVVGLVLVTTARVASPVLRDSRAVLVAAVTFAAVGPLRVNTALVIVLVGVVSLFLHRPRARA